MPIAKIMPIAEFLILVLLYLIVLLCFAIIVAVFFFALFLNIIPFIFRGAFFAQSQRKEIEKMILLANIKSDDKAVDLGSGDGRLLIALAKVGAETYGYEINPILVWWSRYKIKRAGLSKKAFVYWKNFWSINLSNFNIVSVYGTKHIMDELEKKLKKELKPDARVISNYFIFPTWQHSKKEGSAYLYKVISSKKQTTL